MSSIKKSTSSSIDNDLSSKSSSQSTQEIHHLPILHPSLIKKLHVEVNKSIIDKQLKEQKRKEKLPLPEEPPELDESDLKEIEKEKEKLVKKEEKRKEKLKHQLMDQRLKEARKKRKREEKEKRLNQGKEIRKKILKRALDPFNSREKRLA
ncbi:MAG: hypothetical protein U9O94_04690, partial [Nanoarchaeota archaeon]|nr:hypothetical protein [Nanoarchaeota archaeon]